MWLDKVVKETDELRDLISHHINDLRASMCAPKETPYTQGRNRWKSNTDPILQLTELQHELNSQPQRMSSVKVGAMTRKEWEPLSWNGDISEDPDEAGDIEPLNSNEFSHASRRGLSTPSGISHSTPPFLGWRREVTMGQSWLFWYSTTFYQINVPVLILW